jgi:hypothetical protein
MFFLSGIVVACLIAWLLDGDCECIGQDNNAVELAKRSEGTLKALITVLGRANVIDGEEEWAWQGKLESISR